MGFEWRGTLYHELFLPFGLRTAPRIFNYFAEGLHWILDSQGWGSVLHYLDDTLGVFPTRTLAEQFTLDYEAACHQLGLSVKHAKDALGQVVDFLGLEIDSLRMEAHLPARKKTKVLEWVNKLLAKRSCTLLEIQELASLLNFASKVIQLGRSFCSRLYDAVLN